MIYTAAMQFVMGFIALMLRCLERGYFTLVVSCIKRTSWTVLWLVSCGNCAPCSACWSCSAALIGRRRELPVLFSRVQSIPSRMVSSFRWYWFHLACQAGFIVREIFVIQTLNGWYWEVCAANGAMWITLLLTSRQIWNFSRVCPRQPRAVDQILDMLLLPVNYGFLCSLCVRVLKLENTDQNRSMVSVMIDSADIWEAWALWSVLRLFVKVVDQASSRVVEREKDLRQQQLERQQQQLDFLEQQRRASPKSGSDSRRSSTTSRSSREEKVEMDLEVEEASTLFEDHEELPPLPPELCGPIEVHHPETGTRYLEVVGAFKRQALSGVQAWVAILLLTTAGEIGFKGFLAPMMPTICHELTENCSSCDDWYDRNVAPTFQGIIYMLCSAALLFVVAFERVFQDYLEEIQPYWKFWGVKIVVSVTYFQWTILKYGFRLNDEEIYLWHSLVCCIEMPILCILHATYAYPYGKPWLKHLLDDVSDAPLEPELQEVSEPSGWLRHASPCCFRCIRRLERCIYTSSLFVVSTVASVGIICWLLPPELEMQTMAPVYNLTCSEDVPSFIKEHHLSQWELHGHKQEWLPLCGAQALVCPLGYRGQPLLMCTATGDMRVQGSCERIGCGAPLQVEHAEPLIHHQADGWTSGMTVAYRCESGYSGAPEATCGTDGAWQFKGDSKCKLVGCGSLRSFLQNGDHPRWQETMKMVGHHNLDTSYVGDQVSFVCAAGYQGEPSAVCHEGGWEMTDPCQRFETASGCRCKDQWVFCKGMLTLECMEYYGCDDAGEAYSWCEVDEASCPESSRDLLLGLKPNWDTCVKDNHHITWEPKVVPDRGGLSKWARVYIAVFALGALVVAYSLSYYASLSAWWLARATCRVLCKVLQYICQCFGRFHGALRRRYRIVAWRFHRKWGAGPLAWSNLLQAEHGVLRVRLLESVCHEVLSDAEFIDIEQGVEGADEVGRADDTAKMEPAEKPDG